MARNYIDAIFKLLTVDIFSKHLILEFGAGIGEFVIDYGITKFSCN